MARIDNLNNFLTDVAQSIKDKKGTTEKIPAANFDTEIASIQTGTEINNQDKNITSNGTYVADEGFTGLGSVNVNVPQKVHIFSTQDEMLSTTDVPEHTIGVVTDTKPVPILAGVTVDNIYIPKVLVFDTPINNMESVFRRFLTADGRYEGVSFGYSATRIHISYDTTDYNDRMNTEYHSTDGKTYIRQYVNGDLMYDCFWPKVKQVLTRTMDDSNNPIEFTEFEKSFTKMLRVYWDDAYEYISTKDREYMTGIKSIKLNDDGDRGIANESITVFEPLLDAFIPDIIHTLTCYWGWGVTIFKNDITKAYLVGPGGGNTYSVIYYNNCWYIDTNVGDKPSYYTTLNFETLKCNTPLKCTSDLDISIGNKIYHFMKLDGYYPVSQISIMSDGSYDLAFEDLHGAYWPTADKNNELYYSVDNKSFGHIEFLGWHRLLKNATLSYPNELLHGKSGYGTHGLMIGSIPNNENQRIKPLENQEVTIPDGYSKNGIVEAVIPMDLQYNKDCNLIAEDILGGVK